MTTVLFWDIDGTLLTTARAGVFALEAAAAEVIGTTVDLSQLPTAGLTDREIAREILSLHGVEPTPPRVKQLLWRYGEGLPANLPRKQGQVMPGVLDLLQALQDQPLPVLSLLLTGNIQAGARAKLRHYGLDGYFDQGAFADEAHDRPAIARQGLALAQSLVGEVAPEQVYVIGDTPHDIHCGKAIQARTIALATGSYGAPQLETHDPWWLLEQLPSPAVFFEKVGLLQP
jgi:phosphoglycolate phosphatase